MSGINLTRVLLAGLVAGVVINLGEFILWALLLEERQAELMATYGLVEPGWAMAGYTIGALILGISLAFTYAAMRPRFGAGRRTAAAAGGVFWVVGWLMPMVWMGAMGLSLATDALALALVWGLAEVLLAGMAADRVYSERREEPKSIRSGVY